MWGRRPKISTRRLTGRFTGQKKLGATVSLPVAVVLHQKVFPHHLTSRFPRPSQAGVRLISPRECSGLSDRKSKRIGPTILSCANLKRHNRLKPTENYTAATAASSPIAPRKTISFGKRRPGES